MRVDPNLSSILNAGIQRTEQSLNTSVQQLASGQRVSAPLDDPWAAGQNVQVLAEQADVDRFTKNGEAVVSQAQMADSVLSSVISELNQAITLGTQGANGSLTSANRAAVTTQVKGILAQVVSQANTTYNGACLFSGTAKTTQVFVPDTSSPNGYAYQGNSGINQATVGDNLQVNVNVPGDQIFANPAGDVLGSLTQLISTLSLGSAPGIGDAVASVKQALTNVSQQRVVYSAVVNQVNAQESFLAQETISLTSEQQSLTGIDMSTAVSNMTQAQTAHTAVLAAAAKVLPTSLLDYLK